jgi:hypothetical protein
VSRSVGFSDSFNWCKSHLSLSPQDSVKLRVMVKLTQRLKRAGHRLLVFSQSKKMLDIIQKVLSRCLIRVVPSRHASSAVSQRMTSRLTCIPFILTVLQLWDVLLPHRRICHREGQTDDNR